MGKTATVENPSKVRILGALLVVIGAGLAAGMAKLMLWIGDISRNSDVNSAGPRWNATPQEQQITFLILGAVMVFGLSSVITGLWQIISGKRNRKLIWLMLGLWIFLLLLAWGVRFYF
ncbi:MAG: hypothetical protein KDB79_08320 [Acidobacteria bacterium]|nr:hypothetical protein [Acidobacteriota bacterium]